MKISNQSQLPQRGYVVLLTILSISLTVIAFALTAFRETRQAHRVQSTTQVKQDYRQKERAFLRSLVDVTPNSIMNGMMPGASNNAANFDWPTIFQQALNQAQTDQALTDADRLNLSINANIISSNTGDATYTPMGLISSPDGSTNFVLDDSSPNLAGLTLPPSLSYLNGANLRTTTHPIISFDKVLSGTTNLYSEMPYPEISFGYTQQGSTFIAKRNWWAFTVNFGANNLVNTGIAPRPKTYLLSIYEVPNQLAISSAGSTTSLGQFGDGSNWTTNISVSGNIFAETAQVENTNLVNSPISSRKGITLGPNAPSTQSIGGLAERRDLRATTTTNAFFPFSSSSDSGLVSFTPINRGVAYFDYFTANTSEGLPNTANPDTLNSPDPVITQTIGQTGWDKYSIGATQTAMRIEVGGVALNSQLPTRLFISAQSNGGTTTVRQRCERGTSPTSWWRARGQSEIVNDGSQNWDLTPSGDEWFVQTRTLPNGRPCLTLDLEVLPAFLARAGLGGVDVNNSIWIGPNHTTTESDAIGIPPSASNFPSTNNDMSLIITGSNDLSQFTNGLSIITPMRIYFDDNFNDVPATPPAGSGITGIWFPPTSIYAPEKRFGLQTTPGQIQVQGQIGLLPANNGSQITNPLDFRDGGTDNLNPTAIQANLTSIQQIEDLPPINALSWLTVIEEIRP